MTELAPSFFERVATFRQRLEIVNRTYKRDKEGKFASGGGGGGGVRDVLAGAGSIDELNDAAMAEFKRISGRSVEVRMVGSDLQVAKEHLEGIVQAVERFPRADLAYVGTYGPGAASNPVTRGLEHTQADAFAVTVGSAIHFNNRWAADPVAYREKLADEGARFPYSVARTPTGTGLHEMGHVMSRNLHRSAYDTAVDSADRAGETPTIHITKNLSRYGASSMSEFAAEAFADVMTNGPAAGSLSRSAMRIIEANYSPANLALSTRTVPPPSHTAVVPVFFARLAQSRARVQAREYHRERTAVLDRVYKRDSKGRFGSGGGTTGIRQSLQDASTTDEVSQVLASEASALAGRTVRADLTGADVDVAREYAEGCLRGFERFPAARVDQIVTYGPGSARPEMWTGNGGDYAAAGIAPTTPAGVVYVYTVGFNVKFSNDLGTRMLATQEGAGYSVAGGHMSTAVHEYGHHVERATSMTVGTTSALRIAADQAAAAGVTKATHVKAQVSSYAAKNQQELFAEAFADAMLHGDSASDLSRAIYDETTRRYDSRNP